LGQDVKKRRKTFWRSVKDKWVVIIAANCGGPRDQKKEVDIFRENARQSLEPLRFGSSLTRSSLVDRASRTSESIRSRYVQTVHHHNKTAKGIQLVENGGKNPLPSSLNRRRGASTGMECRRQRRRSATERNKVPRGAERIGEGSISWMARGTTSGSRCRATQGYMGRLGWNSCPSTDQG